MRVLIISLTTFTSPYNRGILHALARQISIEVIAGDVRTLWFDRGTRLADDSIPIQFVRPRFDQSWATAIIPELDARVASANPDIVHFEGEAWAFSAIQAVWTARRLKIPIVLQFAENGPRFTGVSGAIRRALASWSLRNASYALGWSAAATAIAADLAPTTPRETMPATGVTTLVPIRSASEEWFGSDADGVPKIAFAGRLTRQKGIVEALAIFDDLHQHMPIRVAIAGQGPLRRLVENWVERRPGMFYHGLLTRERTYELLATADVLLMPSLTTRTLAEQFGKVAVEAMACGTPVFAYGSGALPEVVADGGVVVSESDHAGLVTALASFFEAPQAQQEALAVAARAQAAQFTDEALAERLLRVWRSVAMAAPPTPSVLAGSGSEEDDRRQPS